MRPLTLFLSLLLSTAAHAGEWHRVLLPVWFRGEVPGAFGSRWVADAAGFNASNQWQVRVTDDPEYLCLSCSEKVSPRAIFDELRFPVTERPGEGQFLYLRTPVSGVDETDRVTLELHVRDVSREAEGHGTEVPIVREEDAFTAPGPIALLNIPLGSLFRQKLRIYDFDGELGRTVNVKIYSGPAAASFYLVAEREVTLSSGAVPQYPRYPGFAQLDLNAMPELAGLDRVSVVIDLPDEGRFWAFLSITNNVTQQVTTISP